MSDTATLPAPEALKPAREMAEAHQARWPGESAEYRRARTALLAEEIELRRQIQRVAEHRRALPPGGVAKDYRFRDKDGAELTLADLFGGHDTLFTYFWMYGPERERPCPMCTSFVGSLDIPAPDIEQRVALAIVGRSPVERQLAAARERGWTHLHFYQTVGDDFARDYGALTDGEEGFDESAAVLVWRRDGDKVRLFWAAEGGSETADPGFDPHLAPDPTPLWNILDMTPEGRGSGWYPKLDYTDTNLQIKESDNDQDDLRQPARRGRGEVRGLLRGDRRDQGRALLASRAGGVDAVLGHDRVHAAEP